MQKANKTRHVLLIKTLVASQVKVEPFVFSRAQRRSFHSSTARLFMGNQFQREAYNNNSNSSDRMKLPEATVKKSDQEWRELLTKEEYEVCRRGGTERAFTGALYNNKKLGIYNCTCCGAELFTSDTKFDSGSGWPSFWKPISDTAILELLDQKIPFMPRTEIICRQCHSHLGHVFNDGPRDKTGLRYCINSVCLKFVPK